MFSPFFIHLKRLLFCESCDLCGGPLGKNPFVCDSCLFSLKPEPFEGTLYPYVERFKSFTRYGEKERKLLHLVKFKGARSLAVEIGKSASPFLRDFIEEVEPHFVTYIPTNPFRFWFQRGFDPVEEILKGAEVPYGKLIKRRFLLRRPLSLATKEKRAHLVKEAYRLEEKVLPRLSGAKVLIVDDVITTGSTASQVAHLLRSVGAASVYLFTFFNAYSAFAATSQAL